MGYPKEFVCTYDVRFSGILRISLEIKKENIFTADISFKGTQTAPAGLPANQYSKCPALSGAIQAKTTYVGRTSELPKIDWENRTDADWWVGFKGSVGETISGILIISVGPRGTYGSVSVPVTLRKR